MEIFNVKTSQRTDFIDITQAIEKKVKESRVNNGLCCLFVPHTTAALTINENADSSVKNDIELKLNALVPSEESYTHFEGNSDAHIKSTLVGSSLSIIINSGKLVLGTWQGIYFCEFDGPRNRNVYIKIIAG
ncbi:MAG: secondary thiamine-phosphate synthase enzyme YjbQ [Actinomycetota bacterium]|nr:secondary thiamine-phosphate synthase enzyme YjbQ [Actinomycetota bacterium]